jgi:Meiotically Up-regulated Gene 113 (MUG113) protein
MDKKVSFEGGTPGYKLENVRDTDFIGAYNKDKKLIAIKIGVCARGTIVSRLRVLQTGSLDHLVLLALYRGNVERKLHRLFAKSRVKGEFFKPTPELLQLVDRLRIISNDLAKLESESEPQDVVASPGIRSGICEEDLCRQQ